ncbi:MAG: hypothetical protein ACI4XH_08525 [Acutalibacteraceae bacterium]
MRSFILGTDWWDDCDDAVALRILARAHKSGEIQLKAVGINACMEYSAASLEGFLNSEGVCDIPIGIDLEAIDFFGNPPYQKRLSRLCSQYHSNSDAEDAVRLYRRIIAESESALEIIEIGFLQVIAEVIKSHPDDISPKSGLDLIKEKVSKVWVMAGDWSKDGGVENNFARNARAREAAAYFCDNCPVPVTFLGFEIGADVITGGNLAENDVLHQVLCDHGSSNGRYSWDPMLALTALIGDENLAGYYTVSGTASVDSDSGANHFKRDDNGLHKYVIKRMNNEFYEQAINERIK